MSGIGVKAETEAEALLALRKLITIRPGRVERPDAMPDVYPPEPVRRAFETARIYNRSPETAKKTRSIYSQAESFIPYEAPNIQSVSYGSWAGQREFFPSPSVSPANANETLLTPRWVSASVESMTETPARSESYRRISAGTHRQVQLAQKIISRTQDSNSREPQRSAFMETDDQPKEVLIMNGNRTLRSDLPIMEGDASSSSKPLDKQEEDRMHTETDPSGGHETRNQPECKEEEEDSKAQSIFPRASGVFAWVNRIADLFR
ncbi:hypothetical protein EC973_006980 [Apophysomyces ossiformis]|uniref:Uncharacterized protein n=1 Tax=Apophysomyces ossiformis TaxID=679940 RepID=A0A8H7BUS7_9FUNG|nr:hypothetical protein EC973_006980 [Apophysomyces ossiformis]